MYFESSTIVELAGTAYACGPNVPTFGRLTKTSQHGWRVPAVSSPGTQQCRVVTESHSNAATDRFLRRDEIIVIIIRRRIHVHKM